MNVTSGISVSSLKLLDTSKMVRIEGGVPSELPKPVSEMDRQAQIARQNAEPVNAVFRVGGQPVATSSNSGSTFFANADAPPRGDRASTVEAIAAHLRQRYGSALEVETYSGETGPAYGVIAAEVYGNTVGSLLNLRA